MLHKGISLSSGVAQGTAWVLVGADGSVTARRNLAPAEIEGELARLDAALLRVEAQLKALEQALTPRIGARDADIFGAQSLLVRSLVEPVTDLVREQSINVEAALSEVIDRLTHAFDAIADPTLRGRAADIRDVGLRLLGNLALECCGDDDIPEDAIVVADELFPSLTARLDLNRVRALVSERGARSSHSAILARAQGTPAVTGIAGAATRIKTGDQLIVDGVAGLVYVAPEPAVRQEYERLETALRAYKDELREFVDVPSLTRDGTAVPLYANVSKFADTEAALLYRADGIGLYRTEFGFSVRSAFPSEDEQHEFLERAAARFNPRKVVFRLLDLGGDKELPYFPLRATRNPSLARRGIRLLFEHPQILRAQLRAFLRVSGEHPVSILVPVVSGLEEMRQVRAMVREAQDELRAEGKRFNPEVPIGAMIEVPSAALLVGALAREADFFSLGTNDLVQYVLAADREDQSSAPDYQPLHPAVLRLIHSLAATAHDAGRELTICGEMAGNPALSPLLVGLGLRSFSVAPGQMLEVKRAICGTTLEDAYALAQAALTLPSVAEIEALLRPA